MVLCPSVRSGRGPLLDTSHAVLDDAPRELVPLQPFVAVHVNTIKELAQIVDRFQFGLPVESTQGLDLTMFIPIWDHHQYRHYLNQNRA